MDKECFFKVNWLIIVTFFCALSALVCSIFCLIRLNNDSTSEVIQEFPESKSFFTSEEAAIYLGVALNDLDEILKWAYMNPNGSNTYHLPVTLENGSVYSTLDFLEYLKQKHSPAYQYEEWPPIWPPDSPEQDLY